MSKPIPLGAAKQKPQRPKRPTPAHHKASKPAKPAAPHGSAAHAGPGKQHRTGQTGGHSTKAGKPKRGFSPGVACCAAEALAACLRLQGWPVSDADVLELYRLTADQPDDGVYVEHVLETAATHGLAGARLASYTETKPGEAGLILGVDWPGEHTVYDDGQSWWSWGIEFEPWHAAIGEAWRVTWPELS